MAKTHVLDRHGPVRTAALRVFEPIAGVPGSRADCVGGARPCAHVRCRHHLWLELGADRPGRRHDGRTPPTTLRAGWTETPMPPSCALDVADAVAAHGQPPTVEQLALVVGLRPARMYFILAIAVGKLRAGGALSEFAGDDELQPATVAR